MPARFLDRVCDLGGPLDFPALLDALVTDTDGGGALLAIGNIHGQGEILLERMRDLPVATAPGLPYEVQPVARATTPRQPARRGRAWRSGQLEHA